MCKQIVGQTKEREKVVSCSWFASLGCRTLQWIQTDESMIQRFLIVLGFCKMFALDNALKQVRKEYSTEQFYKLDGLFFGR